MAPKTPAPSAPFEGFADPSMGFFKALDAHQDRAWFLANKARYEDEWQAPMRGLLAAVQRRVAPKYKGFVFREPKLFRIYRDVRFHDEKQPYKTQVSGLLGFPNPREYAEAPAVLYLQIGLESSFAAAGLWMMDAVHLAAYREAVLDKKRGAALLKIIEGLTAKGYSFEGGVPELKTAPRGVAKDHPRIGLLRKRGLATTFPAFAPSLIGSPAFADWVVTHSLEVVPFVKWLLTM
ncbi:MAG: DUF2461 domain-containing protein [Myxococcales bacterium]|nr:DUF2461 domain-containing protein [Myxococcales bacterium]